MAHAERVLTLPPLEPSGRRRPDRMRPDAPSSADGGPVRRAVLALVVALLVAGLLGVVGAVTLAPDRGPVTEWAIVNLGEGGWAGARTDAGGMALVVNFTGRRPFRTGDPCTAEYGARARETSDEVAIEISERRPVEPSINACPDIGHGRFVVVFLDRPLGSRRVVEAPSGRERAVVDEAHLIEPLWLPDGWVSTGGWGADPELPLHAGWRRTWGPRASGVPTGCGPGRTCISLTQTEPASSPVALGDQHPLGTVGIRGATATFSESSEGGWVLLAWVDGGRGYALETDATRVGGIEAARSLLLAVARSLRPGL